jgi:D-amino peptidase
MEGLSGQSDARSIFFRNTDRYQPARQLLTDDVNAVVDGLLAAGAGEVHVVDAHGSGNPDPDILEDQLHAGARLVSRDEPFRPYVDLVEPDVYDAVAVVGMHARTGAGGFASHTYTLGMDLILNGMPVTETELIALSWGRVGVPVIFASGDDKLEENLGTMPWIRFVRVKTAVSAWTAEPLPLEDVHQVMRAQAEAALRERASARSVELVRPVRAALRAALPARLDVLEGVPGIAYADQTVSFQAADLAEAYDGLMALVRVAQTGYRSVLMEYLAAEYPEAVAGYSDFLAARWFDVESGQYLAPARTGQAPVAARQFGAR